MSNSLSNKPILRVYTVSYLKQFLLLNPFLISWNGANHTQRKFFFILLLSINSFPLPTSLSLSLSLSLSPLSLSPSSFLSFFVYYFSMITLLASCLQSIITFLSSGLSNLKVAFIYLISLVSINDRRLLFFSIVIFSCFIALYIQRR